MLSGLIGVALAFSLDFQAARLAGTRVVGTLFAIDPAMAALVGAVALGDRLPVAALGGIALVVLAGAGAVWSAGRGAPATAQEEAAAPEAVAPAPLPLD
ncbi:hypothetical protein [Cellulomonas sp. Y8]|uniref:hypothetical protein n=1 Tax=Cellulomonas sp. Y8 TaxID=2591145 RepID=UPI001AEFD5FF|nr:hypothetical protein [Cellulomonas sp. Y8]